MSSLLILIFLQYSPFTIFWLRQPFSLWFSLIRFMQNYSSRSTLMEYNIPRSAYWNRLWILRTFVIIKLMHIQIHIHEFLYQNSFLLHKFSHSGEIVLWILSRFPELVERKCCPVKTSSNFICQCQFVVFLLGNTLSFLWT